MSINKGYIYMFLSSTSFATMAIQVKIISDDLAPMQIAFWRSLIVTLAVVILMYWRPKPLNVLFNNDGDISLNLMSALSSIFTRPILLLRGILGASALLLYFQAISEIHVSEAVMLGYTYPIFVAILSVLILKERLTLSLFFYLLLALSGVFLINKDDFLSINSENFQHAKLYALASAFFIAGAKITIKKAGETFAPWIIVFAFTFLSCIVSFPFLINNFTPITFKIVLFIVGISISTFFGQFFMTYGIRFVSASKASIIALSTIVFTTLLSIIILSKIPEWTSIIGGLLIFTSGILISSKKN